MIVIEEFPPLRGRSSKTFRRRASTLRGGGQFLTEREQQCDQQARPIGTFLARGMAENPRAELGKWAQLDRQRVLAPTTQSNQKVPETCIERLQTRSKGSQ